MKQHRILVVEDEADVRKVIKLTLSRDPELTVRTCACGQAGLAEAASWAPDLILLDVMMPEMDGLTTLAHLRENPATAPIPVVFLTARARHAELAHFISLGARGAIAKPFVPKELRAAIKGHLQGACHVFGHAWALVRPDSYVAATGESVDATLVHAVGKALGTALEEEPA